MERKNSYAEFAVSHINDLNQLPAFSELLKEHGDFGAEMFAHERLSLNLEGTWLCNGGEDRRAVLNARRPFTSQSFESTAARGSGYALIVGRGFHQCARDTPECLSKSSGSGSDRTPVWAYTVGQSPLFALRQQASLLHMPTCSAVGHSAL